MKPWVRLVLLVVIVVALYVATLVFGVSSNPSAGEKASPSQSSWLASLGHMTARFAPKLDGSTLSCNGRLLSDEVILTEGPPPLPSLLPATTLTPGPDACVIAIAAQPEPKKDFRHAGLRLLVLSAQIPAIYIRSKKPECRFGTCAPCVDEIGPEGAFRLEVLYATGDQDLIKPGDCWLKHDDSEPVSITVLKDETARLGLRCVGCLKSARREIHLTTRE